METEDGWVGLGVVGHRLATIASDFDPRTYGYRKLSDLVRKTGAFDLEQQEGRSMQNQGKTGPAAEKPRQGSGRDEGLGLRNRRNRGMAGIRLQAAAVPGR